jgi:spermidine synthase
VIDAGLSPLRDVFHQFPSSVDACGDAPGGVTGCVVLAESHLSIHTWPESSIVTFDIYVCNVSRNNGDRARRVAQDLVMAFRPTQQVIRCLNREAIVLEEHLTPTHSMMVSARRLLHEERSAHQTIQVHDTPDFGVVLRLDDAMMTSERDDFIYHESLVHPSALSHPAPRSALIIGGGDGGAARELLKHPSIERVTVIELDERVVEVSKRWLPSVESGVFSDPRVNLVIGNGLQEIDAQAGLHDLVVMDLPDPAGAVTALYEERFLERCRACLRKGGRFVLHLGSPVSHPDRVASIYRCLRRIFTFATPYLTFLPLYGSIWTMASCSDESDIAAIDPDGIEERLEARAIRGLRHYNGRVHHGAMALPNHVLALLGPVATTRTQTEHAWHRPSHST